LGRALDHKGDLPGAARKYAQASQLDAGTLSARENHIAGLAKTFQDANGPDTRGADAKAKPVSNPPAAPQFHAAQHDAGWTVMSMG
jgi:hypothetical protein